MAMPRSGTPPAVDALHDARRAVFLHAEAVDDAVACAVERTAVPVERSGPRARSAQLRALAQHIRLIGTQMTAAREDAFTLVAATLLAEAEHLTDLLHAVGGPAQPAVGGLPVTAITSPDLKSTAEDAKRVLARRPRDRKAARRPINQTIARFPPRQQGLARELLLHGSSHAIQRHGHHLTRSQELARLQWLQDPAYRDHWELRGNGKVVSRRKRDGKPHEVGTVTGHYTSPEAAARPLSVIIAAAGRTRAQLDRFLDALPPGSDPDWRHVFLSPETTGITSADVYTLRAPGTDTAAGAELWLRARDGAVDGRGPAPVVREYDMVSGGEHPGSMVVFVNDGSRWRLVTSYFTDQPDVPYTEL